MLRRRLKVQQTLVFSRIGNAIKTKSKNKQFTSHFTLPTFFNFVYIYIGLFTFQIGIIIYSYQIKPVIVLCRMY